MTEIKLLVFDMDGTLCGFSGSKTFRGSLLQKQVLNNAEGYIMGRLKVSKTEAKRILKDIGKEYGENISIALEKKFGLERGDYFEKVWDIPAKKYIKVIPGLKPMLEKVKKSFEIALLSDAPAIWVKNVLNELKIRSLFGEKVFSGEGKDRKNFGNAFEHVISSCGFKPENCVIFGDQEETDIIPAREYGLISVFVGYGRKSAFADYNIGAITEIEGIIDLKKGGIRDGLRRGD